MEIFVGLIGITVCLVVYGMWSDDVWSYKACLDYERAKTTALKAELEERRAEQAPMGEEILALREKLQDKTEELNLFIRRWGNGLKSAGIMDEAKPLGDYIDESVQALAELAAVKAERDALKSFQDWVYDLYESLELGDEDTLENVLKAALSEYKHSLEKLDAPAGVPSVEELARIGYESSPSMSVADTPITWFGGLFESGRKQHCIRAAAIRDAVLAGGAEDRCKPERVGKRCFECGKITTHLDGVCQECLPPIPLPPLDANKPRAEQGVYDKFRVSRTDGKDAPGCKHHGCQYFVLDRTHDRFAAPALRAYAVACAAEYPELSRELLAAYPTPTPTPEQVEALARAAANELIRNKIVEKYEYLTNRETSRSDEDLDDFYNFILGYFPNAEVAA